MATRGNMYEKRMAHQRQVEDARFALERSLVENSRLGEVNRWQSKAEAQLQRVKQENHARDRYREEQKLKAQHDVRCAQRREDQETKLADELRLQIARDYSEKARIARIIKEDPGLIELQSKLKLAYINKARAAQLTQKAAVERIEAQRELDIEAKMEDERLHAMQVQETKEAELRKKRLGALKEVRQQIEYKKLAQLERGQQEIDQDKQHVEEILNGIMEEERAEQAKRAKKAEELRLSIQEHQREHELNKIRKKEAEAEEAAKIKAYNDGLWARQAEIEKAKAAKAAKDLEIYLRNVEANEEVALKAKEREDIHELLSFEELEKREEEKAAARRAKERKMREDMLKANEAQMAYKQTRKLEEFKEEMALREKMMQKYNEEGKKEEAQFEKRRKMRKDLLRQREEQKREKERLYELAKEQEIREQFASKEDEEFRERVVAAARKQLLDEHRDLLREFS